jgi:hypothetical protein
VPASPRLFRARTLAPRAVLAVAVATALATTSLAVTGASSVVPTALSAPAAPAAPAVHSVAAGKPGLAGRAITLASKVSFDGDGRAYSIAADRSGKTYVAWISSSVFTSGGRQVHLCTLLLHATSCKGGIQTLTPIDAPTSAGIRLLVTPGGAVTIVWYHTSGSGGEIAEATSQSGGPLSAEHDVASAPANGFLLDAELAHDGSVWTVAEPSSASSLEIRAGVSNPPTTVHTPYHVGYAQLAFSGSTPILAITKNAFVTVPAAFAYRRSGTWTSFKNVAGTGTAGVNLDLVHTTSGVRLITDIGDAGYTPVVAKWNGHGFTHRIPTGDTCVLGWHDAATDASGRLVDVSSECETITVSNFGAGSHPAILRFSPHGSTEGGQPQIASVPRGYAWVAWSTVAVSTAPADGAKLQVVLVRLPGVHRRVTHRGRHGSVTVTGPLSCLPADTISVSVKGHPKHGWRVASHKLLLGRKKLGSSLNGASLKAGKTYSLKGSVVFSSGSSHETVSATLKFRSCPNP